ncbi:TPA: hypothetical protein HA265_00325 [Candidatus Woesearchaeota archaeon]|nr:hypothetical protein [Candidatus Woesearchaeota archaeon]
MSLRRVNLQSDSDDNSLDFIASLPDPENSLYQEDQGGQGIAVEVSIETSAPVVDSILVIDDEDPEIAGIQIVPAPDANKTVTVLAEVYDADGVADISSVRLTVTDLGMFEMQKVQDIDATTAEFSADIDMQFFYAPGTYVLSVNASDATLSSGLISEFEYLAMTAVSIDVSSLRFTGATLGGTSAILGDMDILSQSPTVRNIGNTMLDMGVYGSDLVDGSKRITVDNLRYSFDNDFGSPLSGPVPYVAQTVTLGLDAGASSVMGFGLQLFVPQDAQNGNYTGAVYLAAVGG